MKYSRQIAMIAFLILCLLNQVSLGARLKAFHTKDEATIDAKPPSEEPNQWMTVDAQSHMFTVTLGAGKSVWIAACNNTDDDKNKYFAIDLFFSSDDGPLFELFLPKGFKTEDDEDEVVVTSLTEESVTDQQGNDIGFRGRYKMTPQPKWERVELQNTSDAEHTFTFTVKLWSKCSNMEKGFDFPTISVSNASFGAPGAMLGDPRVTEMWLFPRTALTDVEVSPTFSAPPETGAWTSEFVSVTPFGEPRPQGGVRFVSDGAGLAAGELFDLTFAMIDDADDGYEMYGFETEFDEYFDLALEVDNLTPIPTVSEWGLIFMALLALTAGTIVFARRRRPTLA